MLLFVSHELAALMHVGFGGARGGQGGAIDLLWLHACLPTSTTLVAGAGARPRQCHRLLWDKPHVCMKRNAVGAGKACASRPRMPTSAATPWCDIGHALAPTPSRQDTAWYQMARQAVDNVVQMVPVGNKCLAHGQAAEGFPLMEWNDICSRCTSEPRGFRVQFEHAVRVVLKKATPMFRPSEVFGQNLLGARMETRYAFISGPDFLAEFGMQPESVPGLKLISGMLDEEGQCITGVLMHMQEGLPQHLAYRTVTLFSEMRNLVSETVLSAGKQVRKEQGFDVFQWCNKAIVAGRAGNLRTGTGGCPRGAQVRPDQVAG